MSALVFPTTLPGMSVTLDLVTEYRTIVHETMGGKKQKTARWTTPIYRYKLRFEGLRTAVTAPAPWAAYSEIGVVRYFFDQHLGSWDSFLWTEPITSTQIRVCFATDDFTLQRAEGGAWWAGEIVLELVK